MRTFLAVDVPPEVRARLTIVQRELTPHADDLKFVAPESVHITVRFLGEVDTSRVPEIIATAEEASVAVAPFTLQLSHVGTFPSGRSTPRVIWIGLSKDAGYASLQRLFFTVEEKLSMHGFDRERREFAPHITVARVREGRSLQAGRALRGVTAGLAESLDVSMPFDVDKLIVFRSDLTRLGPHYTPLTEARLRGDKG